MKFQKHYLLMGVILLFTSGMFTACDLNSIFYPKRELGEAVSMSDLVKDTTYRSKRVTVEGYFYLSSDLTGTNERYSIPFLSDLKFGKDSLPVVNWSNPHINISIKCSSGGGNNVFYAPSSFTAKDLVLYTNEGQKLPYNAKVRISGNANFVTTPNGTFDRYKKDNMYNIYLDDVRIDKID